MINKWESILNSWIKKYNIKILKPVNYADFERWKLENYWFSEDFYDFYKFCNGIIWDGGKILPIFNTDKPKETWDSLQRANDYKLNKYIADQKFLESYYILGDSIGGSFFAIEKNIKTLWFEEDGQLHETDAEIQDFLELMIQDSL
jgi:hypothetical protein